MKTPSMSETIFALATPPGRSAVAVIRVSGALALAVPVAFGAALIMPRTAHRRWLKDAEGALLDDVMLIGFAALHLLRVKMCWKSIRMAHLLL